MKKILTWVVFIVATCILSLYFYSIDPSTPVQAFFMACIVFWALALIVPCIYQIKWRHDNGVDLFATLETNEEKLKEHMLFIMQYHGVEENLKELNEIFRNYPQWELKNWEVFRAWYKAQMDHMLQYPDIYRLSADGAPYVKEDDPLYDPEAPDWSLYDRAHYDDDDEAGADEYYKNSYGGSDAADAIAFGIGLAAGLGIGGSSDGGNSSSDGDGSCDGGGVG